MKIKIHHSPTKLNKYYSLLHELYSTKFGFDFFISDKKKAIEYCFRNNLPISFIEISDDDKCIAHIALIENKQLTNDSAFFGFFECANDITQFQTLWNKLISLAKEKGIKKLLGPVDGAIWFQYRINSFLTEEERFASEPITQNFYKKLLKSINPDKEIIYHSAYRKKFDAIIQITKPSMIKAKELGFEINHIKNITTELLENIYELSLKLFKDNWGYTQIAFKDFLSLYDSNKLSNHIKSIYTVTKNNALVGYCANIIHNDALILKTIGISPDYQGIGIGNALVYKVHRDAIDTRRIKKVIYALIKKENKIKHFPTDDIQVIREYSSYEFNI